METAKIYFHTIAVTFVVAVFNANSPQFDTAEDTLVAGKVDYFAMPKLTEDSKESMPFGGFTISINKDSRNVEDAWTFMKWLSSPETDKKWVQVPGTPGLHFCGSKFKKRGTEIRSSLFKFTYI